MRTTVKIFVLASFCLWFSAEASPQPPSLADIDRATKETDRPVREELEKRLLKAPRKPADPEEPHTEEKHTGPRFFVNSIILEGVETLREEDFEQILSEYENREVYESELRETLTKRISREYLRKGIIAACFIPPQEIAEGVVRLRVIESKMGGLEIKGGRFFSSKRLRHYWPIKPGEVLRYDSISRALQMMNKNPDREVRATLLPGKEQGTTDALLEQKDTFPIHITGSLDNEGAVSTGKTRFGAGLVNNNLLGLDDTLLAGYSGATHSGGFYIYHRLPVTPFGTTLLYGYSRSKACPKKEFEVFNITSTAETASIFVYQDLYKKDNYAGQLSAGLEAKNKHVIAPPAGGTLNEDRLRIMRLGISLVDRTPRGFTHIKPGFSQGMNFLGARRKNQYSSRQAGNTFSKFTLDSQFVYRFPENILAQIRFSGQAASEKLMPQEQLFMGGIDSVRGYPSGDYLADTGYASNLELIIPPFFLPDSLKLPYGERPLKDEIKGIFFLDHGYGMKRGMIQGERSERRMASVGAGLRIRILNQADLRMEWGMPLSPVADRRLTSGGGNNRPWLHFSINFQDNFPQEISRLLKNIGN